MDTPKTYHDLKQLLLAAWEWFEANPHLWIQHVSQNKRGCFCYSGKVIDLLPYNGASADERKGSYIASVFLTRMINEQRGWSHSFITGINDREDFHSWADISPILKAGIDALPDTMLLLPSWHDVSEGIA